MDLCLQKEIPARSRFAFLRRLAPDARGAELFEFALVFPVLIMLLFGIIWIGRAISVYQALERAAREGARVALAPTCASCGNAPVDPTTAIDNALTAASLDPTQASVNTQTSQPVDSGDPTNYQVTGVTVSITYNVQLRIPFTAQSATTIPIVAQVTMRQEY